MRHSFPRRTKAGILIAGAGSFLLLLASLTGGTAHAEMCGTVPCSATAAPTPTPVVTLTPDIVCSADGCIGAPISIKPSLWLPVIR